MLRLEAGGAVCDLLPEVGGAVGRFALDGVDVLRPAEEGTDDPLRTACFPLVPFANRIAHGAFAFEGRTVRLPRNFGDHPHVLHGQGWRNPWRIAEAAADHATLVYDHAADEWPWAYRATQHVRISPDGMRLELLLSNRADSAMPASLGFHPYFPKAAGTVLEAAVDGVWLSDETGIPTAAAAPDHVADFAAGAPLADAPFADHCHFGWTGRAVIRRPSGAIELTASRALDHLHVYNPPGLPFFCAEPVSAMPDAFNRAGSATIAVLPPESTVSVWMTLRKLDW